MDLVAVDWFKDTKRMDHVVRRKGCAAQVRDVITLLRCYYLSLRSLLCHMEIPIKLLLIVSGCCRERSFLNGSKCSSKVCLWITT